MTLNEYQKLAARTINTDLTREESMNHALFGLGAETGEVLGIYQKILQGHTYELADMLKEVGDVLWMIAELCTVYDVSLESVAQMNIDKLRLRYPNGFESQKSLNRREADK